MSRQPVDKMSEAEFRGLREMQKRSRVSKDAIISLPRITATFGCLKDVNKFLEKDKPVIVYSIKLLTPTGVELVYSLK